MYKKLAMLLGITNLITVVLLVLQVNQSQSVKRDILGQYIMSQHNINSLLNNALEQYENGDTEGFQSNLYLTSKEFFVARQILGDGNPVGKHVAIPHTIWDSHRSGMNFINQSYNKALKDDLSKDEIEEIKAYSEKMNRITERLHYDEITNGKNPEEIVKVLEKIIQSNM